MGKGMRGPEQSCMTEVCERKRGLVPRAQTARLRSPKG